MKEGFFFPAGGFPTGVGVFLKHGKIRIDMDPCLSLGQGSSHIYPTYPLSPLTRILHEHTLSSHRLFHDLPPVRLPAICTTAYLNVRDMDHKRFHHLTGSQLERELEGIDMEMEPAFVSIKYLVGIEIVRGPSGRMTSYLDTTERTWIRYDEHTAHEKKIYDEFMRILVSHPISIWYSWTMLMANISRLRKRGSRKMVPGPV